MADLLPCPFCGGAEIVAVPQDTEAPSLAPWWWASCAECGATGPYCRTWQEAGAAWNGRAGLAVPPPTAPADPGRADRPTPVARLLARAAEYDAMPDRLQRGEGNRGRDKWRAKAAAFREAAGMLIGEPEQPDQARAALRAALRRLREGPPHAGAGDPDAWVRELRDDAPATGADQPEDKP